MRKPRRIYKGLNARQAKKELGSERYARLIQGTQLEVGDLIHTCRGYNARIEEVDYSWDYGPAKNRRILYTIYFRTLAGWCTWMYCADPPKTQAEVLSRLVNLEFSTWQFPEWDTLVQKAKRGEGIDAEGCLIPE